MDLFVQILDRKTNKVLNTNVSTIKTYSTQDYVDKEGNTHYLIVYSLITNIYLEEEFDDTDSRTTKLEELSLFVPN